MKRHLINADTGATFGLIAGIILGSLLLNLS
jgi:Na+/glutamate symporter